MSSGLSGPNVRSPSARACRKCSSASASWPFSCLWVPSLTSDSMSAWVASGPPMGGPETCARSPFPRFTLVTGEYVVGSMLRSSPKAESAIARSLLGHPLREGRPTHHGSAQTDLAPTGAGASRGPYVVSALRGSAYLRGCIVDAAPWDRCVGATGVSKGVVVGRIPDRAAFHHSLGDPTPFRNLAIIGAHPVDRHRSQPALL